MLKKIGFSLCNRIYFDKSLIDHVLIRDKLLTVIAASFGTFGLLSLTKKEKNVSKLEINVIINRRNTNERYFLVWLGGARISHVCIRMWVYMTVCVSKHTCVSVVGDDVVPGFPVAIVCFFLVP